MADILVTKNKKFSIASLKDFDALLHCNICKDILNVPVLTPCNHTYCSRCIREYLRNCNEKNCPLCLNSLNESSLRTELLLNEICKCYKKEINEIFLSLTKKDLSDKPPTNEVNVIEEKKQLAPFSIFKPSFQKTNTGNTKKLKKSSNSIIDMLSKKKKQRTENDDNESKCPICNQGFPLKFLQDQHIDKCLEKTRKPEETEIIDLLEDQSNQIDSMPCASDEEVYIDDSSITIDESKDNEYIKSYLQSALKSNHINAAYIPLPKLQLHDISTVALKQNLGRYGLSTQGQKYNLIQRWKQWDVLYTSNFFDNPSPRDIKELQLELNQWDILNNKPIVVTSNSSGNGSNDTHKATDVYSMFDHKRVDIKDDRFSRHQWELKNKKHYKKLIITAKRNSQKQKQDDSLSVGKSL